MWEGFCLSKMRGADAGACGKVFVLAKRVAVTQMLAVRFLSWQNALALTQVLGACGKVFVLAKCVALTQVLVARFLSWQNAWR